MLFFYLLILIEEKLKYFQLLILYLTLQTQLTKNTKKKKKTQLTNLFSHIFYLVSSSIVNFILNTLNLINQLIQSIFIYQVSTVNFIPNTSNSSTNLFSYSKKTNLFSLLVNLSATSSFSINL